MLFSKQIKYKKVIIAVTGVFTQLPFSYVYANVQEKDVDNPTELAEISVTANTEELLSNSKIVKNIEQLEKQQVNNIRDLIRYDAGVSVVEQNRGGSAGFAIRGVDSNRVAISVDGLPQLQSYVAAGSAYYWQPAGSGARNEVELENLSKVEINKGGDSLTTGSGALGGSVNFRTKNVDDILSPGEKFALTSKTAYSGKDSQWMQSVGVAFDMDKLKGLFQYTYRNGKETKVHDNVANKKYEIQRLGAFVDKYKLYTDKPNETWGKNSLFYKCETCTDPFYLAKLTRFHTLEEAMKEYKSQHRDPNRQFTPEELEQLKQMVHPKEVVSAKDYTGPDRTMPDPLKSTSHSYLARLTYQLTPNQSIEGIFEDTKQRYLTRDMTLQAYYDISPRRPDFDDPRPKRPREPKYDDDIYKDRNYPDGFNWDLFEKDIQEFMKKNREFYAKMKEYNKNHIDSKEDKAWREYDKRKQRYDEMMSDFLNTTPNPSSGGKYLDDIMMGAYAPMVYTKSRFSTEVHRKQRQSLRYVLEPQSKWGDRLELSLDFQKIGINSDYRELNCSKYPKADRNCRASKDKPGSSEDIQQVSYQETHKHVGLKYNKSFNFDNWAYRLNISGGGSHYKVKENEAFYFIRYGGLPDEKNKNGDIYVPGPLGREDARIIRNADRCQWQRDLCSFKIKGKNRYFSINNQITIGNWLDIGAGFRIDRDKVWGNRVFLTKRKYKNTSYQFSTIIRPIENISIGYNYSTGFRNPSFQEIYGWSGLDKHPTDHLKPETSTHHEFNVSVNGKWGYIEANKFISNYKDLISFAFHKTKPIAQSYNFSNASIEGYGIQGWFDLHSIISAIPSGFSTRITYERTKPKKASVVNDELKLGLLYPFDAIQPPRFVVSLNYDDPSEKWGGSLIVTHSKEKDVRELATRRVNPKYQDHSSTHVKVTNFDSKPWTTVDLLGYYQIGKNMTLNVGVYNLFNKEYSTWESVRRSSSSSVHREREGDIARYTAPGRNYFASFSMKF
ncbi:lactoferrin/transferrin family TonB-dependent receptor [Pelistega ratti]|uniref:lactoferrin/transferrin family TonB-dependent receptor n=1 Tax=Pelistega ratti TaxID=2652177 RepID=UPI0013596E13|nr:lactoferrin/transferrin family TonB-dependent receptor [Pelistega ratti]